jgi:hypothetical protein
MSMKKMTLALAMFGALSLSACAHGGHHGCCGGDECKMDSSKKSCCHEGSDECKMKDSKTAPAAAAGATEKAPEKK